MNLSSSARRRKRRWSLPPANTVGCIRCVHTFGDSEAWASHRHGSRCLSPEAAGLTEIRSVDGRPVWGTGA